MSEKAPGVRIFLAVPSYDGLLAGGYQMVQKATRKYRLGFFDHGTSLLAFTFNMLVCTCKNHNRQNPNDPFTHFAMVHADVIPEDGFLDKMMGLLIKNEADVLSVSVPIKNEVGLTSTALDIFGPWQPHRRIMSSDQERLPEVFNADDCGFPGVPLLINTGCWLGDIRKPWWDKFPGFTIDDRIETDEDGDYIAKVEPEDWNFARYLHGVGARYFSTFAVEVRHIGKYPYNNQWVHGSPVDEAFFNNACAKELPREPLGIMQEVAT